MEFLDYFCVSWDFLVSVKVVGALIHYPSLNPSPTMDPPLIKEHIVKWIVWWIVVVGLKKSEWSTYLNSCSDEPENKYTFVSFLVILFASIF